MPEEGNLMRVLTLKDTVFFSVGVIIGAGIYAIIGEAAAIAGNMLWLAFLLAALVATLTALTYAEFVSRYPDAGGSFEYIRRVFGMKVGFAFGILMAFTGIVASSAIAISFADYLSKLWELPPTLGAIGIIVAMSIVNIIGIGSSSRINILATVITLAGLALVIAVSLPHWGDVNLLEMPEQGFGGVLAAGALIFFSYVGFEDVVKTAEETKNPRRVVGKGIIIASLIVMVIYLLVAISSTSVIGWQKLSTTAGPLTAVVEHEAGKWAVTSLVVVALFATANSILTNILGTSRLMYDIARDTKVKWMKRLTHIPKALSTPVYAIIIITALTITFALIGNLKVVASLSNVFVYIAFITVNVALLSLRYKVKKGKMTEEEAFTGDDPKNDLFKVPWNIVKMPVPTILALVFTLVFFGYNLYNLFSGGGTGH